MAIAIALTLLGAPRAGAVTYEVASTVGVMQQPTSHYYLATYGAAATIGTEAQGVLGTVRYVERPEFKSAGYADKDFGAFAMVGTKVTKTKDRGLYAYFGGGRMQGYTKVDRTRTATSGKVDSTYALNGLTASLDYAIRLGPMDLAAGHQTFVGYVDDSQLKAYVAWPFNFFHVTIGVAW